MKKLITVIKYLFFPFLMSQATGTANLNTLTISNNDAGTHIEMKNTIWPGNNNGIWLNNNKVRQAPVTFGNSNLNSGGLSSKKSHKRG